MNRLFLLFYLSIGCNILAATSNAIIKEKVIICGSCKNVASCLPVMMPSIEEIGNLFIDYKVFVYENNSSDSTVSTLKTWAQNNLKVHVISENFSQQQLFNLSKVHTWDGQPFRTEVIAHARNTLLEHALHPKLDEYSYVIMLDMDFRFPFDTQGIIDSFRQTIEWDAICANGITDQKTTYDRYALRNKEKPLGPELLGDAWWDDIRTTSISIEKNTPLVPVYSAFGGLAIYKRASIKGCHYSGIVTKELESLTRKIILDNNSHSEIVKYFNRNDAVNTIILLSNEPGALKWICNSGGYELPVCCEHVIFHAMMFHNNHGKIFINPKMVVQY